MSGLKKGGLRRKVPRKTSDRGIYANLATATLGSVVAYSIRFLAHRSTLLSLYLPIDRQDVVDQAAYDHHALGSLHAVVVHLRLEGGVYRVERQLEAVGELAQPLYRRIVTVSGGQRSSLRSALNLIILAFREHLRARHHLGFFQQSRTAAIIQRMEHIQEARIFFR